jgi:hypothetical protein
MVGFSDDQLAAILTFLLGSCESAAEECDHLIRNTS